MSIRCQRRQAMVVNGAGSGAGKGQSARQTPSSRRRMLQHPATGSHRYSSSVSPSIRPRRRSQAKLERSTSSLLVAVMDAQATSPACQDRSANRRVRARIRPRPERGTDGACAARTARSAPAWPPGRRRARRGRAGAGYAVLDSVDRGRVQSPTPWHSPRGWARGIRSAPGHELVLERLAQGVVDGTVQLLHRGGVICRRIRSRFWGTRSDVTTRGRRAGPM